jgi:uncharacterized cupin superfamily protein
VSIAHWDDVEPERGEVDPLASWLTDLGTAVGSVTVGVTRWQVDPGKRSTPAHVEYAEEEIFYVLAGSGLSWQDGETFEARLRRRHVATAREGDPVSGGRAPAARETADRVGA